MKHTIDEVALSEVVGFVLLLALIVAALSLYMVYVVPVSGREAEISQMTQISEQFTDYKFTLDNIRTSLQVNNLSPVMTSTSFNLGTGGGNTQASGLFLYMLQPVSSTATLAINTTGDSFDIDSSSYHSNKAALADFPINITSLEYRSNNNYGIQQRYSYQLGGVFLSQDDGITNRISPLISITSSANNSVVVHIVPVQLVGGGSLSGNGPAQVNTRQRILPKYNISTDPYLANTWVSLSFTSADNQTAAMWLNIFKDMAIREQLSASAYTTGSVWNPVSKRTTVIINITGTNPDPNWKDVSLYVKRSEFYVALNNIAPESVIPPMLPTTTTTITPITTTPTPTPTPTLPPAPTVTGVSPSIGTILGGTSVTVTGTGFTGATAVTFGATAAPSFTVDSATQITATSPAGSSAGPVNVTVTTPSGTSATSPADIFRYYVIQSFTAVGTTSWSVPSGVNTIEYLVVAGGGGGGRYGGGGGAGGFRTGTLTGLSGSQTVTVGGGGAGSTLLTTRGTNGGISVFASVTAAGGGGGGSDSATLAIRTGAAGGSGGGGERSTGPGGAGNTPSVSPSQGNNGGSGARTSAYTAGGGGGAGAAGSAGTNNNGGNGGVGIASAITGASVTYSGGGGGGCNSARTAAGSGGAGGGGAGGDGGIGSTGTNGLGGGGGGGGNTGNGGTGGSGIVIIRYY